MICDNKSSVGGIVLSKLYSNILNNKGQILLTVYLFIIIIIFYFILFYFILFSFLFMRLYDVMKPQLNMHNQ